MALTGSAYRSAAVAAAAAARRPPPRRPPPPIGIQGLYQSDIRRRAPAPPRPTAQRPAPGAPPRPPRPNSVVVIGSQANRAAVAANAAQRARTQAVARARAATQARVAAAQAQVRSATQARAHYAANQFRPTAPRRPVSSGIGASAAARVSAARAAQRAALARQNTVLTNLRQGGTLSQLARRANTLKAASEARAAIAGRLHGNNAPDRQHPQIPTRAAAIQQGMRADARRASRGQSPLQTIRAGGGLPLVPAPAYQRTGIGGGTSARVATADMPTLARAVVQHSRSVVFGPKPNLPPLPSTPGGIRYAYQQDVRNGTPLRTVRRLGVARVASVLFRPDAGFKPTNRTDIGIVQGLLRAEGRRITDPRGVWGQSSQTALVAEYKATMAREQAQFEGSIAKTFYNTGLLHAGQAPPAWFPNSIPRTPTPAGLAKILQTNSFQASMVARSLARRLKDPDVAFIMWRRQQLARIYNSLNPVRVGATFTQPSANSRTMAILLHPAVGSAGAQAEMKALLQSRDMTEFSKRMALAQTNSAKRAALIHTAATAGGLRASVAQAQLDKLEAQERAQALGIAREHRSWLGNALHSYEQVLDRLRISQTGALLHLVSDPYDYVFHNEDQREEYERRAADWIDGLNPVSHFAYEMLTDPINYIPFGKVAKLTGELAVVGTRAGGRSLIALAEADAARVFERFGINTERGLDSLKRMGEEVVRIADNDFLIPAARRVVLDRVATFPLTRPLYRGVELATRTKRAATQAAKVKVLHAASHAYRPTPISTRIVATPEQVAPALARRAERDVIKPSAQHPDGVSAPAVPATPAAPAAPVAPPPHPVTRSYTPRNPEVNRKLGQTYSRIHDELSVHASELVRTISETGGVLWSNVARIPGELSSVGASLRARMIAHSRVVHIHETGREFGDAVAEAHVRSVAKELGVDQGTKDLIAVVEKLRPGVVAESHRLAREEYWRVVKASGVYRHGPADPEVYAVIQRRVRASTESIDRSILPVLQDLLEETADRQGELLFGPDGKWLYGTGSGQEALRSAARESFEAEVKVPNPLAGQYVDPATARMLADDEIETRTTALKAWFAREVERGNPEHRTEAELNTMIADVEEDVTIRGWRETRDPETGARAYVDQREELSVSPLYAGHHEASLQVSYEDSLGTLDEWESKLASIGLPKADVVGDRINREIGNLVWSTTRGFDEAAGRQINNPIWREGVAKFTRLPNDTRVALERSVASRGIALEGAYADTFSRALRDEGALYAALQHAQSRPLKILHTGLAAHLAIWKFATLPLSPAWYVRNTVDNTAKSLIQGVRDPRAYFPGWLAKGVHAELGQIQTVFDHNLNALAHVAGHFDGVFGTRVEERLRAAMDTLWDHSEETLASILKYHGIEVPGGILSDIKDVGAAGANPFRKEGLSSIQRHERHLRAIGVDEDLIADAVKFKNLTPEEQLASRNAAARARDWLWDVMGNRPEDRARRRIYQHTFFNARERYIAEGYAPINAERKAFTDAAAKVEKVLFDYSKISVAEHNLSLIFPFVQFWRKNSAFWLKTAAEKPWVVTAVAQWEEERQRMNDDWPAWMRRYVPVKTVTDVIARVPALGFMANIGAENFMYDPLSFFSFRPLWGIAKELLGYDNPLLPDEKKGWFLISGMVDAFESAGLGVNPLFRQPFEHAGVLNQKPWRQVFPQTTVLAALSRKFLGDTFADGIIDIDSMFADPIVQSINALTGNGKLAHEIVADNFDKLVELEMVNQLARGEVPSRERATKKLQGLYLVQAVVGSFTGTWLRVMTPEDVYIAKLVDSLRTGSRLWDDLTAQEKTLITARSYAKDGNPGFDDYVDNQALVKAFYTIKDFDQREAFKQEHPQILPYVDPVWKGHPLPHDQLRKQILAVDTQTVITLHRLFKEGHVPYAVRQAADDVLITPELKKFWAENDTPQQIRDRARKAEWHRHIDDLNKAYFAIPKTDYDARREFLKLHPELADAWNENNSDSDDWKLIGNGILQGFKDIYFHYADQKNWDAANKLLEEHPFIFDKFLDDRYVLDRETGRPKAFGERWGFSNHARAYLQAKPFLDQYFALPKAKRAAWLHAGSIAANKVLMYFRDWADPSKQTPKAKAYLAAEADLNYYFDNAKINPQYAREWLQSSDPGAARVRAYFAKYGKDTKPKTQQAKDYLAAKPALDHYFGIKGKAARSKWLAGTTLEARRARAYFDKYPPARGQWQTVRDEGGGGYSKVWVPDYHAIQVRDYLKAKPALDRYFKLPEEQRSAWLQKKTADAEAVLVYFNKYADKTPDTQHARDYSLAKPALEQYFALGPEGRRAFLNSGSVAAKKVLDYFNKYGDPAAGSRSRFARILTTAAHRGIRAYYNLPAEQRAAWLARDTSDTIAVRAYFNAHGGIPSGRPTTQHAVDYLNAKPGLDTYFAMPEAQRRAWLDSDDPQAKLVRDYFAKGYLSIRGITRQSIDYSIARRGLATYFGLPPAQRSGWLASGDPDAALVQHYFRTYAKMHTSERAFRSTRPSSYHSYHFQRFHDKRRSGGRRSRARSGTIHSHIATVTDPQLRGRLEFWQRFFELAPSERPAYVKDHAESAGVFVYGVLGDQEQHDSAASVDAMGHLHEDNPVWGIKPFLDLYYSLPPGYDRELLRRGNPELAAYLDGQGDPLSEDAGLRGLLAGYFRLPYGSGLRASYLAAHPEIQAYFDAQGGTGTGIRQILSVYFHITNPMDRRVFLAEHPELSDYFDERKATRDEFNAITSVFDQSDPRFRPYLDAAKFDVGGAAGRMRYKLALSGARSRQPKTLARRSVRQPVT